MVHLILIITNYFLLITLFNTIYLLYSLWGGNSLFYNFLFPGGNSYHFELPPWGMDFANIFIYTLWDGLNLWTSPLRTGLYLFISSPLRTGISLLITPPPWGVDKPSNISSPLRKDLALFISSPLRGEDKGGGEYFKCRWKFWEDFLLYFAFIF